MVNKFESNDGVFSGILAAYSVLVLHMLLLAGLALFVVFFRGVIQYMIWIFLGSATAIVVSGYRVYSRMKHGGKTIHDMMISPLLYGRSIEVNLFGGIASIKIGQDNNALALPEASQDTACQLEDPSTVRIRELSELVRMLENNLITLEEFNNEKRHLLAS